jgi:hypothetical protein
MRHIIRIRARVLTAALCAGAILLCGCERQSFDMTYARPYEVVTEMHLETSNGRTAWQWQIVSDAGTIEERGETIARAALDLHSTRGAEYSMVLLYPSPDLVGSTVMYAYGFFASDGRAGQGLTGADPEYRARWRIFSSGAELSERELSIAESWYALAPDFPSRNPLSSTLVDTEALRERISEELGISYDDVRMPRVNLELWHEALK